MLLGCISLLTGPWSLANSDEQGGGIGFWGPWVYVWLLGCANVREGIRYSLRFWPAVDAGRDCLWMDVYSGFTLSLIKSHSFQKAALEAGFPWWLSSTTPALCRPQPSSVSFCILISIFNFSLKNEHQIWGERQFLCLLQAHCLWQTERCVGVCACPSLCPAPG